MATRPEAEPDVQLHAEVAKLAKDFKLEAGKLSLPQEAFVKWRDAHAALSAEEKNARGADLVALAVRFEREASGAAIEALGQLAVLTAGLVGQARAQQAFKAAGVGWQPKPKPAGGKGWGSP